MYHKCTVYDFTGRESTGQFLRMLNEALDAEIKKLGEDEVIKGYLKHFSDHENPIYALMRYRVVFF